MNTEKKLIRTLAHFGKDREHKKFKAPKPTFQVEQETPFNYRPIVIQIESEMESKNIVVIDCSNQCETYSRAQLNKFIPSSVLKQKAVKVGDFDETCEFDPIMRIPYPIKVIDLASSIFHEDSDVYNVDGSIRDPEFMSERFTDTWILILFCDWAKVSSSFRRSVERFIQLTSYCAIRDNHGKINVSTALQRMNMLHHLGFKEAFLICLFALKDHMFITAKSGFDATFLGPCHQLDYTEVSQDVTSMLQTMYLFDAETLSRRYRSF